MDLFTLVGKIAIDCTEAETKIDTLLEKANQLNKALGGTGTTGTTGTTENTGGTGTTEGGTTTAQSVAAGTVAGNWLTAVTNMLGGWVIDFGKEGYSYEVEKETYIAELKTMMNSTWEEAEAFFNDLNALAISTPLNMGSLGAGASRFLSLGYNPEEIVGMMQVIGDLAKGDNASFVRILKAVSDVMAKTTLQAQEKNQFSEVGIPLYALLADYYGMSYETDADKENANKLFMEKQQGGDISAVDVWNALVKSTQEGGRFHNAMSIAMETTRGQSEKLDELSQKYGGTILSEAGLMNVFKGITEVMNNILETEVERLEEEGLFGWKNYKDAESFGDVIDVITAPTFSPEEYYNEGYSEYPSNWQGPLYDGNSGASNPALENAAAIIAAAVGTEVRSAIADSVPGAVSSGMGEVSISTGNVTLNDGALVGRILPRINVGLGQMTARDMRG